MNAIRVALSGSGFKFPAHVGALMALKDEGYTPIEIAGTSGGSIIAALYASGMPLAEMYHVSFTRDWSDMLTFSPWSMLTKLGYCSGSNLQDWIGQNTKSATFKSLSIDLQIVASDINNAAPFIFNRKNTPDVSVALAARASAAIPFVYAPVQLHDAFLMDGGMVNNIAVDKLVNDDVPKIGIQLVTKQKPLGVGLHSMFDIAPRLVELMLDSNENTHVDLGKANGAQIAFVETGFASGLDRNMSLSIRRQLYDEGYAAAIKLVASLQYPQAGPAPL